MTPQQLIDMRGAGNAEKWLRENGKWELTADEYLHVALKYEHRQFAEMQKDNPDLEVIELFGYQIGLSIENALNEMEAK